MYYLSQTKYILLLFQAPQPPTPSRLGPPRSVTARSCYSRPRPIFPAFPAASPLVPAAPAVAVVVVAVVPSHSGSVDTPFGDPADTGRRFLQEAMEQRRDGREADAGLQGVVLRRSWQ